MSEVFHLVIGEAETPLCEHRLGWVPATVHVRCGHTDRASADRDAAVMENMGHHVMVKAGPCPTTEED